jgi:hypothetical protein
MIWINKIHFQRRPFRNQKMNRLKIGGQLTHGTKIQLVIGCITHKKNSRMITQISNNNCLEPMKWHHQMMPKIHISKMELNTIKLKSLLKIPPKLDRCKTINLEFTNNYLNQKELNLIWTINQRLFNQINTWVMIL